MACHLLLYVTGFTIWPPKWEVHSWVPCRHLLAPLCSVVDFTGIYGCCQVWQHTEFVLRLIFRICVIISNLTDASYSLSDVTMGGEKIASLATDFFWFLSPATLFSSQNKYYYTNACTANILINAPALINTPPYVLANWYCTEKILLNGLNESPLPSSSTGNP